MKSPVVEEFAKILVEHVRDWAIRECDLARRGESATAKRWRAAMEKGPEQTAEMIIPDCVDDAIFGLLRAVDEGLLRLRFVSETGKVVDLATEGAGEMAGWYATTDGWRHRYSKERFADDTADLELD